MSANPTPPPPELPDPQGQAAPPELAAQDLTLETVETIADLLKVSPRFLRYQVAQGRLPAVRLAGQRCIRLRRSDVAVWINSQRGATR